MTRTNSPGAIAALGRASAHVAKAIVELRQAERELDGVRGLGRFQRFITDVGVFKFLGEVREMISHRSKRENEGLRLVTETPEEGDP
jgi:hypothetical protein